MSDARSDADLIAEVRAGDESAYAELYRRHAAPALRFARSLARSSTDADDLVAEAFARVLAAMKGGNGPGEAFRPYLLSAVKNAFYDTTRRGAREQATDDLAALESEVPFVDPVLAKEEDRLVTTAFEELPERWQLVLWHTEVEGEKPAEVAPLLGISPNAVAALAYRAREGLRERYLQAHLTTPTNDDCRPTLDKLAAFTRRKLSRADSAKVTAHLATCASCALIFGELSDVNARIGLLVGPVALGGAAAGYVAAGAAFGGTASGLGTVASVVRKVAQRREAQVGLGVAGVAGLVALALVLISSPSDPAPAAPALPTPAARVTPPSPTESSAAEVTVVDPLPSNSNAPETPSASAEPPGVTLAVSLDPVGSLVRGRPGVLALVLTAPAEGIAGPVTAIFSLPSGVTLRGTNAGNGWTCTAPASCTHGAVPGGTTTRAYVPVSVSGGAADGIPSVTLTGSGVAATMASASRGIESGGLGAVFVATGPVAVVGRGNGLLSCPFAALGCYLAQWGGTPFGINNDDYDMTPYVEAFAPPGFPVGATVSSAAVSFPGEVLWAGLYWAGSGSAPAGPTAYVRAAGSGTYQPVPAARVQQVGAGSGLPASYQASADITNLARSAGPNGSWWVSVPASAFTTGPGAFGGWAVLAVVRTSGPDRTVAVLDAGNAVRPGTPTMSTVYGLSGVVTSVGLVAWDGDRGTEGDRLSVNGAQLGAPYTNNIASSGAEGVPWGWDTFGTDARTMPGAGGPSGPSGPQVSASTTEDAYVLGALAVVAG